METGFEPVYTALQAVASPLGHSTNNRPEVAPGGARARIQDPLRADDGIRTRDPHLGKVMRYQLRYVRMLPTGLGPAPRPGASRTVADPGSSDQPGSGQIVGDHLIERIVDIDPQGLVSG